MDRYRERLCVGLEALAAITSRLYLDHLCNFDFHDVDNGGMILFTHNRGTDSAKLSRSMNDSA